MATASRLKAAYQSVLKAKGVPYLSVGDPALQMLYEVVGGLNPEQARAASQYAADYYKTHGFSISDAEFDQHLDQLRGPTGTEGQYDPLVGVGAQIRQGYGDLVQARGGPLTPTDPQLTALINSTVPGLSAQQAQQIAQRGRDYYKATGTVVPDYGIDQYAGQVKQFRVPLAHQMAPGAFEAMQADPVAKGLFEATLGAKGYDPASYYGQHLAARPRGTAPRTSSVGRQFAGIV
jgi:hypothetical protein